MVGALSFDNVQLLFIINYGEKNMEDKKEIWNKICKLHNDNYAKPEYVIQRLWEDIFKQYLQYNSLENEITTKLMVHLGSSDRLIPDIILRKHNKDLVVVELKRGDFESNGRFRQQLFSYLKQLKVSVGILITNKIEVFAYDYAKDDMEQKSVAIEFTLDNPMGEEFVTLFNKSALELQAISNFVENRYKMKEDLAKIKVLTDEGLVKKLLLAHFKNQHFEESAIYEFLNGVTINIVEKQKTITPIVPKTPLSGRQKLLATPIEKGFSKNDAVILCQNNGVALSRCVTFANLSGINGKYPANVNLSYLADEWTILLNDSFRKKLHILKIPANTFTSKDFTIRRDKNLIVLHIEHQSFVDSHPQERVYNELSQYKVKTIDYSQEG